MLATVAGKVTLVRANMNWSIIRNAGDTVRNPAAELLAELNMDSPKIGESGAKREHSAIHRIEKTRCCKIRHGSGNRHADQRGTIERLVADGGHAME